MALQTTPQQLRQQAAILTTHPQCSQAQLQLALAHLLSGLADLLEKAPKEKQG